ncbi:MAG: YfhO family protein, partial [Oscillospiraceae bacterium]|nr:YfhO family protein [Oscillospiraceae bacterium]
LVFFSVPYDKGWSAFVNGEEVVIEKANTGFMAVRVPAGNAYIRFNYMTPGLFEGAAVSAAGIALLIIYLIIAKLIRRRKAIYDIAPMQFAENIPDIEPEQDDEPKFGGELQKQLESLNEIDIPQSPEQEDE